jgi:DNA polymerase-3 subunit alpha
VAYWSVHTHSKYSAKDALPSVADLVARASDLDFPALGLTDHGTAAGIFELYKHSRKAGIIPVPGVEMYVALNRHMERPVTKHMGVVATTSTGWNNLIGLVNHSMRYFRYKPIVDFSDLAQLADDGMLEGLSVLTGCFFGVLNASMGAGDLTATNLLLTLQDWFDGRVFVEVQNHYIATPDHVDAELVMAMVDVANRVGAPIVVANDAHYTLRAHTQMHNMLKFLSSWNHDDPDSALFPGDGYWLCSTDQMRGRFTEKVWDAGVAGLDELLNGYDLAVPMLDEFKVHMPSVTNRDPVRELTERINTQLDRRLLGEEYARQADAEMKVIAPKGFAEYLLLVASITDWMTEHNIAYLARGSASGSAVCWLLGITQVDPLEYNLRFDRFLSVDRIKPPDIDLDVEHNRRDEALEYLEQLHPSVRIGNWRTVRLSDDDPHKGSLWVEWERAASKGMLRIRDEQRDHILQQLSDMGTYGGMGKHAAGLIIAPDIESVTHLPRQWLSNSETMVTALDMHNVEELGFIKVDLLGSRTLTAVASALRTLGLHMDQIPLDDKDVFKRMASGKTTGIFQLQGWSASAGCRQLKPRSFNDVVHAGGAVPARRAEVRRHRRVHRHQGAGQEVGAQGPASAHQTAHRHHLRGAGVPGASHGDPRGDGHGPHRTVQGSQSGEGVEREHRERGASHGRLDDLRDRPGAQVGDVRQRHRLVAQRAGRLRRIRVQPVTRRVVRAGRVRVGVAAHPPPGRLLGVADLPVRPQGRRCAGDA